VLDKHNGQGRTSVKANRPQRLPVVESILAAASSSKLAMRMGDTALLGRSGDVIVCWWCARAGGRGQKWRNFVAAAFTLRSNAFYLTVHIFQDARRFTLINAR